jgi:hypothetical protein
MNTKWLFLALISPALALPCAAQDSVSKTGCLPGDAVSPWDDTAAANGSEQENSYVVDMTTLTTSWGNVFGIAPIVKGGKSSPSFFTSLMAGSGISRRTAKGVPFSSPAYAEWNAPGFGVNNDPAINDVPGSVDATGLSGHRFATVFAENGVTGFGGAYQGVVSALVNVDPENPTRLYVKRIQAAVNGCDATGSTGNTYTGAIDEDGNLTFRTDGFGSSPPHVGSCGLLPFLATNDNNLFLVASQSRNPAVRNVISNDYLAGGAFDPGTTKWLWRNNATNANPPSIMPASVTGGLPYLIGTNFAKQYVRGDDFATLVSDLSHLTGTTTDHRGNLSYCSKNFPFLNSTHGIAAILAKGAAAPTDRLLVFGLGANGVVTGAMELILPGTVTDNSTGFSNLGPGPNEFDHYHSQVGNQGGTGQVAINLDPAGNLLLAAEVDHPTTAGSNHAYGINYIAVCRVTPAGATAWTMAGYQDGSITQGGKPILDGPSPGGNVIGQMCESSKVAPTPAGPSVSGPMIDAGGNVWFTSAIELLANNELTFGLLRAVYDPTTFKFDLELVTKRGDVHQGMNSGLSWQLSDLPIADSNSVASDTAWSQNISEEAHLGADPSAFGAGDVRHLGGMALSAGITYDVDLFGDYVDCQTVLGSTDERYRTMLYLSPITNNGTQKYGSGCSGSGGFTPVLALDGLFAPNQNVTLKIEKGLGGSFAIVFFGLGGASAPMFPPCTLNIAPLLPSYFTLPLFGAGAGNGAIAIPLTVPNTLPTGFGFTMQAFVSDPGVPSLYSNTNGLSLIVQ